MDQFILYHVLESPPSISVRAFEVQDIKKETKQLLKDKKHQF